MSLAAKLNKGSKFFYRMPEGSPYYKLEDLDPKQDYEVKGLWINEDGKFGPSATLICDGFGVNLPRHLVQVCRDILASEDLVEGINAGVLGFRIRKASNKAGQEFLSVEWVDL